jgi:RluA family pseudouridine synthase
MKYLKEGLGRINGRRARPGDPVAEGDEIELPGFEARMRAIRRGKAAGIPAVPRVRRAPPGIRVLYEDEHLLVIDKPPGVVMHPGKGHREEGLDRTLAAHFGRATRLVHRLDRDTSGVLVCARGHPDSARRLTEAFREGEVRKVYLALVSGVPKPPRGLLDAPLLDDKRVGARTRVDPSGRSAVTEYETLEAFQAFAWLRLVPRTGRRHQIRVHLAHAGHPLAVDPQYARRRRLRLHELRPDLPVTWKDPVVLARTPLHASELTLRHPATGEEMTFCAPLPEDLASVLDLLRQRGV